jgi:hypothetical protein
MSTTNAPATPTGSTRLSVAHMTYLTERAVDLAVAEAHGLQTVDADEAGRLLGRSGPVDGGGLAIPYPSTSPTYARLRCDDPDAAGGRYLAPAGIPVPLFVPDGIVAADGGVILVVESAVKALALVSAGFSAVGLAGTGTTLDSDEDRINDSWDALLGSAFRTAEYVICFDTGRRRNPAVARDEARLGIALRATGALVSVARMDQLVSDSDAGPDDVLANYGRQVIQDAITLRWPSDPVAVIEKASSAAVLLGDLPWKVAVVRGPDGTETDVAAAFRRRRWATSELSRALKQTKRELQAAAAAAQSPPAPVFVFEGDCLLRADENGVRLLASFAPRVTADIHRRDEFGDERLLEIRATCPGRHLGAVRIAPAELEKPGWATTCFGAPAILHASASEVRTAMLEASSPVPEFEVRTQLGYYAQGDELVYAHAGGTIPSSTSQVAPSSSAASKCRLPTNPAPAVEAAEVLLRLREVATPPVAVLLLAALSSAPLQHFHAHPFLMGLVGPSGVGKTTAARIATSAYAVLPPDELTIGFNSTGAAVEHLLFEAKDLLIGIDDFAPGTSDAQSELTQQAERMIRSIANRAARQRMTATMSAQKVFPPRAAVLFTAEERPGAMQSIVARTITAHVGAGDVRFEVVSEMEHQLDVLRSAVVAFIEFVGKHHTFVGDVYERWFRDARTQLAGIGGHARIATAIAHLHASLRVMFAFLRRVGLAAARVADLEEWAWDALLALGEAQRAGTTETDPVLRFVDMLEQLLAAGTVHLVAPSATLGSTAPASGPGMIGWRQGASYLLLPDATFNAVNEALVRGRQGNLGVKRADLINRLADRGYVKRPGTADGRLDAQRKIGGKRVRVLEYMPPAEPHAAASGSTPTRPPPAAPTPAQLTIEVRGPAFVGLDDRGVVGAFDATGIIAGDLPTAPWIGSGLLPALRAVPPRAVPSVKMDAAVIANLLGTPEVLEGRTVHQSLSWAAEAIAKHPGLEELAEVEYAVLAEVVAMERAGVPVNHAAWTTLVSEREKRRDDAHTLIWNELEVDVGDSSAVVTALAAQRGIHVDGVGKEHLRVHDDDAVVKAILSFNRDDAFLRDLGPKIASGTVRDGRARATLDSFGTETGRFTAVAPNLLGLEKAAEVRHCIEAPEGSVIVSADVSAADLRSLAAITQDPELLRVFQEGRCPHKSTAAQVLGVAADVVTPDERALGKAVNFAAVYGSGAAGLVQQATQYKLRMSIEDAETFLEGYRRAYCVVAAWQDAIAVDRPEFVQSLMGRRRRVRDLRVTRALNAPVQMTTADGFKIAVSLAGPALREIGSELVLPCHDELVACAPVERAEEALAVVKDALIRGFRRALLDRVSVVVTGWYARSWVKP